MIQVFKTWGELPSSRPLLHAGYLSRFTPG